MNAPDSLTIVPEMASPLADVKFPRVLVPVDFSVCTLETLLQARTLAEKLGAVVDVLHVLQPTPARHEETQPRPGLLRLMAEGARQELQSLVRNVRENADRAVYSVRIREGRPHEVILREACATNATLIIMGRRSRSWWSGLLRRHTVKRVLQNSPCPVMVLNASHPVARTSSPAMLSSKFRCSLAA